MATGQQGRVAVIGGSLEYVFFEIWIVSRWRLMVIGIAIQELLTSPPWPLQN